MASKVRTFTQEQLTQGRGRPGGGVRFRTGLALKVRQGFEWEGSDAAAAKMAQRLSKTDGRKYGALKIDGKRYVVCIADRR